MSDRTFVSRESKGIIVGLRSPVKPGVAAEIWCLSFQLIISIIRAKSKVRFQTELSIKSRALIATPARMCAIQMPVCAQRR